MKREIWLDFLRVTACFLVMTVHSTEPFYLGGEGSMVLTGADAFWVSVFEGLARCCVPLFVIASGYLQLPLRYSTCEFFRRRAVRILIPLLFWTVVYALVWGSPAENFKGLLLNFNYAAGHLWFVYMLLGLYLIMPLLSPWAASVSKRELSVYLGIWGLTLLIPFIRESAGGPAPLIYAADGLPAPALFPLWGEASWNPFGLLYYLSGFAGYMLLGLYIKRFVPVSRLVRSLGWTLFLVGFIWVCFGFMQRIIASGPFPVEGPVALAVGWEAAIAFCGLPVALTAVGLTLAFRRSFVAAAPQDDKSAERYSCHSEHPSCHSEHPSCHSEHPSCHSEHPSCHSERSEESLFYRIIIRPLSEAGYGMYLAHMLVLALVSGWLRGWLGIGPDGLLGSTWTTPVEIIGTALISFVAVGIVAVFVRKIPVVGKWIIG